MQGRPINFVRHRSENYQGVQDQIFGLIKAELDGFPVSETIETRRDDAINFGLFIRMGRYKEAVPFPIDVLMSHGLADKNYLISAGTDGDRLVNSYEHVLVPGRWFAKRLRRRRFHPLPSKRITLRKQQVHLAGWPRLDALLREQNQRGKPNNERVKLLWAPSHDLSKRERSFSSYPAFERYLPALGERFDVRVSLHPANRRDNSPTTGDLGWADVVVSDSGTLLYEAFALGKCVIMPTWLLPPALWRSPRQWMAAEGHIYARGIGNHARSFEHLVELATRCEPPGRDVRRFMGEILAEEYRGHSSARVADLLKTLPLERHAR